MTSFGLLAPACWREFSGRGALELGGGIGTQGFNGRKWLKLRDRDQKETSAARAGAVKSGGTRMREKDCLHLDP